MAKVFFELKPNRYTVMLQKADDCVMRIAKAAEPSGGVFGIGKTFYPKMAIKCYRDGETGDEAGSEANEPLDLVGDRQLRSPPTLCLGQLQFRRGPSEHSLRRQRQHVDDTEGHIPRCLSKGDWPA